MRTKVLLTGIIGATGCMAGLSAQAQPNKTNEDKPNILLIYTDDMGIGDISSYNSGWVETPNIDRIAASGMTINNYYTAAPVSSASRTGLTTGMFPAEWGITTYLSDRNHNANCEQFDYLNSSAPSMARILKAAGYNTGHFGKWHMGGGRDVYNAPQITEYGFDEYVSTWESPDADPLITGDTTWIWSNKDEIKRWDRTAYFVDKTLDFLSRHKGEPCFVNLWPDDVHTPWVPDQEASDSRKGWQSKECFAPVLEEYDRQIGRLLDGLKKLGLDENTIVIFTSDNGPAPSFEELRTNGLRGVKNSLYEGGIRMPFLISWAGHIEAGSVDEGSVISAVDLLPTFCAITGAKMPKGFNYSGQDVSNVFKGKPMKRKKDLMWDFGRNKFFNSPGNKNNKSPHLAIRSGDWKLLMNSDGSEVELYDMRYDENETINLADRNPKVVNKMSRNLLKWWDKRMLP